VFAWFETPKPVAPRSGTVVTQVAAEVLPKPLSRGESVVASALLPQAKPLSDIVVKMPAKVMPQVVEEPGKVWVEGEPEGVVLVVQGQMPDSRCVTLAKAMMAAVGLQDMAIGWVGYSGKVDAAMLVDAVRTRSPQQVMVLGQAPLGVLLGRNLGVEGWHAAETPVIAGWDGALADVAVGVTYPLDLLIKQPLFKRLAWQHLLAWGEGRGAKNKGEQE
jgi:hypothetical protein